MNPENEEEKNNLPLTSNQQKGLHESRDHVAPESHATQIASTTPNLQISCQYLNLFANSDSESEFVELN